MAENYKGINIEKVAIYCRVSTEEQRERESIQTQIVYAKDYCQKQGYLIYDVYPDNGVSGTVPFEEREAGRKLFLDAREGKFKTVLVYKIDRIGRDNLLTLEAVFKLNKLGINIKSMTEMTDRSNAQGRFLFNFFVNLAEWEKEQIRERTLDGKYAKARSGKFPGGIIPYGYLLNKEGYLEIDENLIPGYSLSPADIVRQIFSWIGKDGVSTIETAKRLNNLGIPATKCNGKVGSANGLWRHDGIRKMVVSTAYIGTYIFGRRKARKDNEREPVSIPVPPIIDKELWVNAQRTLVRNRAFAKRNTEQDYLLRGIIKCNFCGRTYIGFYRNERNIYYRCYGRTPHFAMVYGDCIGKGKSIRKELIEDLVWNQIEDWLQHPEVIEAIVSAKFKELKKECGNNFKLYNSLRSSLEKKKEDRERVYAAFRKGLMSLDVLESQLKSIESEETELSQMAEDLRAKMLVNDSYEDLIGFLRKEIEPYGKRLEESAIKFEEKRKIVETFVREVRVNMIGNKLGRPLLVETIPFKENIERVPLKDVKVLTVYSRDGVPADKSQWQHDFNSNFAEVVYQFPFPPREYSAIVNPLPRLRPAILKILGYPKRR